MELGSAHDAIVQVAKSGVLLALEHNMLPKPILQEALRCMHGPRSSLNVQCMFKLDHGIFTCI